MRHVRGRLQMFIDEAETKAIIVAFEKTNGGTARQMASWLGISLRMLFYKMSRLGLSITKIRKLHRKIPHSHDH